MLGLRENAMSATPITDKIIEDADACPETRIVFLIKNLANKCREFERMYNAALVCAGVASKERGEWAVERDAMLQELDLRRAEVLKAEAGCHIANADLACLREALQGIAPMFDNDGPLLTVYAKEIEHARAALKATA